MTSVEHYPTLPKSLYRYYDKVRAEGHCRMCQRPHAVRPLTRHHLVPQSWFLRQGQRWVTRRNLAANIIPLCRPCHDGVERWDDLASRRMLRRVLTQEEIAFAWAVRGPEWFNRWYPR